MHNLGKNKLTTEIRITYMNLYVFHKSEIS